MRAVPSIGSGDRVGKMIGVLVTRRKVGHAIKVGVIAGEDALSAAHPDIRTIRTIRLELTSHLAHLFDIPINDAYTAPMEKKMSGEQSDQLLAVAMRAARAGGELALSRLGNPGYMRWKEPGELQAGASLDIQQRIVQVIKEEFPDHKVLVEESDEPQDDQADPLWIIDPIDGSMNFNQSLPLFAVSIAFRAAGRYELGVVYDPCNNELFHATFGHGAYLNGQPIFVDKLSEGEDAYARAFVGVDLTGNFEDRRLALYINRMLGSEVTQTWTLGSPALGLCYVAAGRLHAYYCLKLALWDVAAAGIIIRESGGTLTDITGESWLFSKGGYLATNGVIHGSMLRGILPPMQRFQGQQGKVA